MAKDWDRYKSDINTLYIANGKSLGDVRRILKGRHHFDASVRAYRMKLEEWGMRKNKVASDLRNHVPSSRPSKTTSRNRSSLKSRSSNVIPAPVADGNTLRITPEPILQFQNHEAWAPGLHFSASDGQNLNSSSLAAPGAFHENSTAPYLNTNEEMDFTSQDQSIHEAITHGTEVEITNLLSSGISVSTRDGLNNSPLHTAILGGNISIVKSLLNFGADVDAIGFKGKTPLHLAVVSTELVQLLLKHQPTLSLQDDEGNTILHYILFIKRWWDDLDVKTTIKTILSSGVDINITNKSGESPLHRIVADIIPASWGYMEIVSEFLNYKPNVTSPMRNGLALLAVFLDNSDILSLDNNGLTVGYRCLEQFLVAGADPNITFHSKPLLHYCLEKVSFLEDSPTNKFIALLIQKAQIGVAGFDGNYPLHLALARPTSRWGNRGLFASYAITAALVAQKANVNQTNAAGASPLEVWLSQGSNSQPEFMKVALLLVKAGAITTTLTSTGKTLFDLLTNISRRNRIFLNKAFLEADIKSRQGGGDIATGPEWLETWRSAWKQPLWHLAKAHLTELEEIHSLHKNKEFGECAALVIVEHLLQKHRSQLRLWQTGVLNKESVKENYEDYCAILRHCRERQIAIDVSWYTYLLDLMDFK